MTLLLMISVLKAVHSLSPPAVAVAPVYSAVIVDTVLISQSSVILKMIAATVQMRRTRLVVVTTGS